MTRSATAPLELDHVFYCRARRRRMALARCLEEYVSANAFLDRQSLCYRCPQGCRNRASYAWGVTGDPQHPA